MVEIKKKPDFKRKDWHKKSKLGLGRKKKQKWVRPRGRHNKMREKKKGHAKAPIIGFSQAREIRGKVQNLTPVLVNNVSDLQSINKESQIAIFSSVGMKRRIGMAEKVREMGIKTDFNVEKFLEKSKDIIEKRKGKRTEFEKGRTKQVAPKKEEKPKTDVKPETKGKKEEEKKKIMMQPMEKEEHRAVAPKETVIKRKALEK